MFGLLLPEFMKLKGPENYAQWKPVMIRNIIASGLIKYLKNNDMQPGLDLSNWQSLREADLEQLSEWVKGNTKVTNAIMYNCNSTPQSIITHYSTVSDMWNALEQAYEGTGILVQH
ncbi:hypothetical protein K3495_g7848 [Podosphaera aphanis]|nr:hypothetical protein K3495_g7848 [Podosphaera aphanis]